MAYQRLGDLLISNGLITEQQLNEALTIQKQVQKRLGTVLIEYGLDVYKRQWPASSRPSREPAGSSTSAALEESHK